LGASNSAYFSFVLLDDVHVGFVLFGDVIESGNNIGVLSKVEVGQFLRWNDFKRLFRLFARNVLQPQSFEL